MKEARQPTNLIEAIRYFSDPELAFAFMLEIRWPDGKVTCPRCGHGETSFLTTRRIWKCKGCKRQFSLKVGTIFEDSPLGWDKWLPAIWLIANSKNSISSHELGRSLGVTQNTAWFLLHRIREAMRTGSFERMSGITEVDDTFIGGLAKNMHRKVRKQRIHGTGGMDKMIVQGARNRDTGTVTATVIQGTATATIQEHIFQWVETGSALYTDVHKSYGGLEESFALKQVNHSTGEYVSGDVHTNGIENYWSLLKRGIKGTQIHVSASHLNRYVTERTFAYNHRKDDDLGRMRAVAGGNQRAASDLGHPDGELGLVAVLPLAQFLDLGLRNLDQLAGQVAQFVHLCGFVCGFGLCGHRPPAVYTRYRRNECQGAPPRLPGGKSTNSMDSGRQYSAYTRRTPLKVVASMICIQLSRGAFVFSQYLGDALATLIGQQVRSL